MVENNVKYLAVDLREYSVMFGIIQQRFLLNTVLYDSKPADRAALLPVLLLPYDAIITSQRRSMSS